MRPPIDEEKRERGAIYTPAPIAEALLELAGYRADRELASLRLLEPSFGGGDILLPAVDRLLRSYLGRGGSARGAGRALSSAIRAVELHRPSFLATRAALLERLERAGLAAATAERLCGRWLREGDFLLEDLPTPFDAVVGNPPYVRQERIPKALLARYRGLYPTLHERADLYVPFFERGLDLLSADGSLAFVCANRWMKNRFGAKLREKIAEGFALEALLDLEEGEPFGASVLAYPAILLLRRGPATETRILRPETKTGTTAQHAKGALPALARALREGEELPLMGRAILPRGRDPWLFEAPALLPLLRRLEASLPSLEESGAEVGIGVATGCDRVFLGDHAALPVEPARKLPLAMARDLRGGRVEWGGVGVINPFLADGELAPLADFPRFARHLHAHEEALRARYVARRQPDRWYRTIDRIRPGLASQPKLLIPDIKAEASVAYDPGRYYPHHNLYVITSEVWDLEALMALLRSSVALLFVAAYGPRMSGGYLRFQAQYLRRVRVPSWASLPLKTRRKLRKIAYSPNRDEIDAVVFELYSIGAGERAATRSLLKRLTAQKRSSASIPASPPPRAKATRGRSSRLASS